MTYYNDITQEKLDYTDEQITQFLNDGKGCVIEGSDGKTYYHEYSEQNLASIKTFQENTDQQDNVADMAYVNSELALALLDSLEG